MIQARVAGQLVPYQSLQPPVARSSSRPGISVPAGVMWLGRRKTQLPQRDTPSRSTGQGGILWPVEDTNVSRLLLCIRDGENRRKTTQTRRHPDSGLFSLTTVCAPPRPWSALRHSDWWFWEPSSWWGASGGSRDKLIFRSTISPETHHLLNWISSQKEQQFSTAQVWKSLWNHIGSENQSWFFAVFKWSTRETTPEFQMWGSPVDGRVCQASADSFRKRPRTAVKNHHWQPSFSFHTWTSGLTCLKRKREEKKSWHSLFCFLNFLVQLTHDKRMSFSINFNSAEQKNREFIGNYWKQKELSVF